LRRSLAVAAAALVGIALLLAWLPSLFFNETFFAVDNAIGLAGALCAMAWCALHRGGVARPALVAVFAWFLAEATVDLLNIVVPDVQVPAVGNYAAEMVVGCIAMAAVGFDDCGLRRVVAWIGSAAALGVAVLVVALSQALSSPHGASAADAFRPWIRLGNLVAWGAVFVWMMHREWSAPAPAEG
jgi:hypothetical protein